MFRVDAVYPDYGVAGVYLGVEGPTARISNQSTLLESEDIHQKPLSGFNVLVHSQRDDAVGTPGRSLFLGLGRRQFCGRLDPVIEKLKDIEKPNLRSIIGGIVMASASGAELIERARSLARAKKLGKDCVSAEVGCALVTSKNNLFVGVSIDADCGIGTCAEHGAIQNMLVGGESRIKTIVAVAADGTVLPPCGRCRELIYQINRMNRDTSIIVGKHKVRKLKNLLPEPWQKAF